MILKIKFIQLLRILQEYDLIGPNYKIIPNRSFVGIDQLTISNISEEFLIYKKVSV